MGDRLILGIDPGPETSGMVLYRLAEDPRTGWGRVIRSRKDANLVELRAELTGGDVRNGLRPGSFEVERYQFETSPFGHFGGDEGLVAHFAGLLADGDELALLERIQEVRGIERIRFTSPHPRGFRQDLVEALIRDGADTEQVDAEGHSALTRAAMQGNAAVVSSLLSARVSLDHAGPGPPAPGRLRHGSPRGPSAQPPPSFRSRRR